MIIEIDYSTVIKASQEINNRIGANGIQSQIKRMEYELQIIQLFWREEANTSHIKALQKRVSDLKEMQKDMENYQKVLEIAGNAYKDAVEKNIRIAKGL